ncbi:hypothetical protein GCK72_010249 [Caenorhabditis remanei]|uniref:Uncharacterized protein n=1 Tax=Caenorhabditis remanei TaxID=31234 RepID=A0A6A5H4P4_CAERE|nr:hypothetical protein GCK72_010249 [Caenorhabditis remanei]KAF1761989.1 hypothetical protein GCK72_010249 [Caenorhabditis remanei]
MLTNPWIICILVFALVLSTTDARISTEKRFVRYIPSNQIRGQSDKTFRRSRRDFDPQTSPLNTIRSALQWRPNSQQPQGQVFIK